MIQSNRLKYCKSVHYMQCSLKYGVEKGREGREGREGEEGGEKRREGRRGGRSKGGRRRDASLLKFTLRWSIGFK